MMHDMFMESREDEATVRIGDLEIHTGWDVEPEDIAVTIRKGDKYIMRYTYDELGKIFANAHYQDPIEYVLQGLMLWVRSQLME
jgi:hypothetical protein